MKNAIYDKLLRCVKSVREKTDFEPKVAIVLGSGLGDYANDIKVVTEIPYEDIEEFPVSTVPGHAGKFIFGYVDEVPVVCMKGRVHYYEPRRRCCRRRCGPACWRDRPGRCGRPRR